MSEDQKQQLEKQLWNIANTSRGKMNADEFCDYILGFIFYKYLSEKLHLKANQILKQDGIDHEDIDESTEKGSKILETVRAHKQYNQHFVYFQSPKNKLSIVY